MATITHLLTRPAGAGPVLVRRADEASLPVALWRGYSPPVEVRCVEVNGRLYPLHHECPDDGFERWSLDDAEAAEVALDAIAVNVPEPTRQNIGLRGWMPFPVRKARRALANAKAARDAATSPGERQAATAAVQAARAALDAAKLAAGTTEPEPDE